MKRLMKSPAVLALLAVMVVLYVAQVVNPGVADLLSLPGDLADLGGRPWSPLTVMFVHELLVHVALMVLMLAAFGPLLEESVRALHVVAIYLLGGLAGSLGILAAISLAPGLADDGNVVGASAAVLGVTAAVLALRPSSRIFGGTAKQWLAILVAINIMFLSSMPLGSIGHLAGIGVGWAYGKALGRRSADSAPDQLLRSEQGRSSLA